MRCKRDDCFTRPYPDCINDYVPSRTPLAEEQKKQMRDRGRARYQERKAAGLCARYGKRPPEAGRVRCWRCLREGVMSHRGLAKTPRYLFDGVERCKTCGKPELEPGKKLCPECYAKACRTLASARSKNAAWGRLNSLAFRGT